MKAAPEVPIPHPSLPRDSKLQTADTRENLADFTFTPPPRAPAEDSFSHPSRPWDTRCHQLCSPHHAQTCFFPSRCSSQGDLKPVT